MRAHAVGSVIVTMRPCGLVCSIYTRQAVCCSLVGMKPLPPGWSRCVLALRQLPACLPACTAQHAPRGIHAIRQACAAWHAPRGIHAIRQHAPGVSSVPRTTASTTQHTPCVSIHARARTHVFVAPDVHGVGCTLQDRINAANKAEADAFAHMADRKQKAGEMVRAALPFSQGQFQH